MCKMIRVPSESEWNEINARIAARERYFEIRRRKFEPITDYEPDPNREEWQNMDDCLCCPYLWGWDDIHVDDCTQRLEHRVAWDTPMGDPSFCQFTEYRKILFRKWGE